MSQDKDLQWVKDAIVLEWPKERSSTEVVKLFWLVRDELVVYEDLLF